MKNPMLLPVLSMLSAAALAQAPRVLDPVTIPARTQSIELPERALKMRDIDFGMYQGAYDLANGKTLYLVAQGKRMYAQIDDGDRHELAAAPRGAFVALDRQMRMRFERLDSGELGGELLLARTPEVAGRPVEYELLVARR
ncbi:hypothetical protein [Pseudoduganella namucuonensis]|uniref:Uncharacterized protein n=1 Tax=Pseudoduganella namucuonensis TaxID=1035707 RepID=A0A1I7IJJ8_9BURK|nr:hypothetical protein [Pseudoduganella namucuonensis]SFU73076.1 hypothetical protein SAMN05216552_100881 [Pseudoduganella namucuonensis]